MISARPRLIIKVAFLKLFALEVWVSISTFFLMVMFKMSKGRVLSASGTLAEG